MAPSHTGQRYSVRGKCGWATCMGAHASHQHTHTRRLLHMHCCGQVWPIVHTSTRHPNLAHWLFFCCERLSASMARSLHLSFICIPQSARALDQDDTASLQRRLPKPGALAHIREAALKDWLGNINLCTGNDLLVNSCMHEPPICLVSLKMSTMHSTQWKKRKVLSCFFPASALWPVWPGQSTVSVGRKLYRSI